MRGGRGRDRKEGASRAARAGLQPGGGSGQEDAGSGRGSV